MSLNSRRVDPLLQTLNELAAQFGVLDGIPVATDLSAEDRVLIQRAGNLLYTTVGDLSAFVPEDEPDFPLGILDVVPGAESAYSPQRLSKWLAGPSARLRNGTTNEEINFTPEEIAGATVTTWLAGATCYAVELFNQAGGSTNLLQTDPAKQPLLIGAGTDHPYTQTTGTRYFTAALGAVAARSLYCLAKLAGVAATQQRVVGVGTDAAWLGNNSTPVWRWRTSSGTAGIGGDHTIPTRLYAGVDALGERTLRIVQTSYNSGRVLSSGAGTLASAGLGVHASGPTGANPAPSSVWATITYPTGHSAGTADVVLGLLADLL